MSRDVKCNSQGEAMRSRAKDDAIQSAARKLFLSAGLRETSMDAIAADANVSKQTLYRYFGTKEQLFVEVLGSLAAEGLRTDIADLTPPSPLTRSELEETLLRIATRILGYVLDPTYLDLLRILIAEARNYPDLARRFRATVIERVAAALVGLLASPQLVGIVTIPRVEPVLRLFIAPLLSYELEGLLGDLTEVRKRAEAELPSVVSLFVRAISASEPSNS
jgi:TetR/AcrR family transcriptional repressor of mexJK operon